MEGAIFLSLLSSPLLLAASSFCSFSSQTTRETSVVHWKVKRLCFSPSLLFTSPLPFILLHSLAFPFLITSFYFPPLHFTHTLIIYCSTCIPSDPLSVIHSSIMPSVEITALPLRPRMTITCTYDLAWRKELWVKVRAQLRQMDERVQAAVVLIPPDISLSPP